MDFFERQDNARRKTRLLVVYFALAVILTVVAINGMMFLAFTYAGQGRDGFASAGYVDWFNEPYWLYVTAATLLVIGMGSAVRLAQLSAGGSAVAEMAGGRRVDPATKDPAERRYVNIVEEMSIASGVPVPEIYVLYGEHGINAFAAGYRPTEAAVAVTKGALDTLDRDELQGVIGHEFSHILNGDMRINVRLIGILAGIIVISQIGYFLMRATRPRRDSSGTRRGGNPLPMIGFGLFVVGYIGLFFGRLIKSAISRQREHLADSSSVQFTRNPDGIAHALWKIRDESSLLLGSHAEEMSHMCFGETVRFRLTGLFSTHPPLDERIKSLSPRVFHEMTMAQRMKKPARPKPVSEAPPEPKPAPAPAPDAFAMAGAVMTGAVIADASGLAGSVGNPGREHIDYAEKLHASLPAQLLDALHSPETAISAVYALLMGTDGRSVGAAAEYLTREAGAKAAAQAGMVAELVGPLGPGARLPLVDLAMPALRRMEPESAARFIKNADALIRLDEEVTLFEYALITILKAQLMPKKRGAERARYGSFWGVEAEARVLLSALSHAGSGDTATAYAAALGIIGMRTKKEGPVGFDAAMEQLDTALGKLAELQPKLKKKLLEACAGCVLHDGKVDVSEGELLRAVAARLDSPMPPILPGQAAA